VGIQIDPPGPAVGAAPTSLSAFASVTGPAAGAVLASIAVPAGTYQVAADAYLSGTVAAVDGDNVQVQSDPVTVGVFVNGGTLLMPAQAAAASLAPNPVKVVLAAKGTIQVVAIALATATAVYHVTLRVLAAQSFGGLGL